MNRGGVWRSVLGMLVCIVLAPGAIFAEKPDQQMDPAMEAMMKAFLKYGAPGVSHQRLEDLAGTWNVESRFWLDSDSVPERSSGTSEIELIMDGRYALESFEGMTPQGKFTGLGITGYDNIKGKYVTVWIDSMSTGIFQAEGNADIDGNAVEFHGESPDPMIGSYKPVRTVETVINAQTRTLDIFEKGPDGNEFRSMEMVYTRR